MLYQKRLETLSATGLIRVRRAGELLIVHETPPALPGFVFDVYLFICVCGQECVMCVFRGLVQRCVHGCVCTCPSLV